MHYCSVIFMSLSLNNKFEITNHCMLNYHNEANALVQVYIGVD